MCREIVIFQQALTANNVGLMFNVHYAVEVNLFSLTESCHNTLGDMYYWYIMNKHTLIHMNKYEKVA